jgi:hypothetical protein
VLVAMECQVDDRTDVVAQLEHVAVRLIALIEASAVERRILTHLGLPTEAPTPAATASLRRHDRLQAAGQPPL